MARSGIKLYNIGFVKIECKIQPVKALGFVLSPGKCIWSFAFAFMFSEIPKNTQKYYVLTGFSKSKY